MLGRVAVALGMLIWTAAGPGVTSARAAPLSTGVLSDQGDAGRGSSNQGGPGSADPSDKSPATPFGGFQPPNAKIGNAVSAPEDPLVASVEGHSIYLSDLGEAAKSLPEALGKMPFEVIYPTLLDRMIDHEAVVLLARRQKLDDDPVVKRQIEAATARVLEAALLQRMAVPTVTEAAIRARYARDFTGQGTVEEVHARHILVASEAEAKRLIGELNKGSDFATLARRVSKDPDAARGGDLGFFRHDQVWAGFADLAFSLKPGEVAQTPIHNEFGWHVVQTLERRRVAPQTFEQVHDAIRTQLLQEAVQVVVAEARKGLRVTKFNMDGTPMGVASGADELGAPASGDAPKPRSSEPPATAAPVPVAPQAPQKTEN
jgi:peptidyl-prolyl cis-trans isomerase C